MFAIIVVTVVAVALHTGWLIMYLVSTLASLLIHVSNMWCRLVFFIACMLVVAVVAVGSFIAFMEWLSFNMAVMWCMPWFIMLAFVKLVVVIVIIMIMVVAVAIIWVFRSLRYVFVDQESFVVYFNAFMLHFVVNYLLVLMLLLQLMLKLLLACFVVAYVDFRACNH